MQQKISPDLSFDRPIDLWSRWVASPLGRYVLEWEQAQLDLAVADVFGFHAIQLGFPEIDSLRGNRISTRALALRRNEVLPFEGVGAARGGPQLRLDQFEDLPFADDTVDLLVLPHVLELALDPHQVLREAARVLRPEGRILITGFNPISLWGARDVFARPFGTPLVPLARTSISLPRLRDWLEVLSFQAERGRHGCYRPPLRKQKSLERCAFMEQIGDRLWPICGAVYLQVAVKRVRSMRLVGPAWKSESPKAQPAIIASPRFDAPAPPPR